MKLINLEPGNIWSGDRNLAVFTNPTEIAFRKDNLRNHYPVTFNKVWYQDAEAAYQALTKDHKEDLAECKHICMSVIEIKFIQYPILVETIRHNGGSEWLMQCRHIVNGNARWEGAGLQSLFIQALLDAYHFCS